jgi:putative transposase
MNRLRNRKSNRLREYDYASDNLYFITSCVQDRRRVFGNIRQGKMELNVYGQIAEEQLKWMADRYDYVTLHEFVIMPDHMHAVIEINRKQARQQDLGQKIKSLSELMGVFKTTSSKHIRLAGLTSFEWQRSFHDHIIRNHRSYENIVRYIRENPENP